jgi:hypothetical protein
VTNRRATPVLVAVLVLGGLVGCSGSSDGGGDASGPGGGPDGSSTTAPDPCATAVADIVSATAQYVRGYEATSAVAPPAPTDPAAAVAGAPTGPPPTGEEPTSGPTASTSGDPPSGATTSTTAVPGTEVLDDAGFQEALADAEAGLSSRGGDPGAVRGDLVTGFATITAGSPVAEAVRRQLTATLTGTGGTAPADIDVAVGDDLRDVVAGAAAGSTIRLGAGAHRLDGPLVLLEGITIVGAGREATTLVSTAPEGVVLVLADARTELRALSVRHEGDAPGSALLGGPAASLVLADVRLSGGTADAEGEGGAGILLYGEGQPPATGTTLEVTDVEVRDNAAGIVLTGGHRASMVRVTVAGNGQCGICFLGTAGGSVEDSVLDDNGVGIAATGSAQPALLRLVVTGGQVGVQAADDAAPSLQDVTVSAAGSAAIIFGDRAAGALDRVTCQDVPFGIVVSPDATPQLGETDCEVASTG